MRNPGRTHSGRE